MTTLSAPIIFRSFIALMMEMFSPIVSSHKAVWSESKSSRDIILRKIEFVCLDLVRQLSVVPSPSRLVLRASEDDAQKQIVIQSRQSLRLAYIIQCLAQIYRLILNNQQSSKRDLYYEQKKLYKGQQNLDRAITTICDLLNEPRISLNIISSSKGILFGALAFMTKEEKLIDCRCQPVLITEALRDFRIISGAQFIIVVEKDAVFQKLIDEGEPSCNSYYVRWPRVRLNFKAVSNARLMLGACESACSLGEDPQTPGRLLECAALNHHQSPDGFSHQCDIFQPHQLQNVDGYVEADDRYSFYWRYCLNSSRKCSGEYAFTFLSDRYMDAREVLRVTKKRSLEDCLVECLNENAVPCRSVSFNRTDGGCHISADSQLTKPLAIHLNNNPNFRIDYYENNCYNLSDIFKFEQECREEGILVKVKSKFPYTGALYGLYDFFTCRLEPKELKEFEYLFPSPTTSRNCSDSIRFQGDEMVMDVVLSTDGVEPLYFITADDLTYQAKCPLINTTQSSVHKHMNDDDARVQHAVESTSSSSTTKVKSTASPLKTSTAKAKLFKQTYSLQLTTTEKPLVQNSSTSLKSPLFILTTAPAIPVVLKTKPLIASSSTSKSTTKHPAKGTTLPTATHRALTVVSTTSHSVQPPTTTTIFTVSSTKERALSRALVLSTIGPPAPERPDGVSKPTKDAVSFDIFHNGQPVEAVVVGTKLTLSFAPLYAIPPEYMSVRECQVEPIDSKYEWEREPLPIIREGCQADLVGLVCPPQHSDFGVKVIVESFRYQSTPHVQYSCLVRVCPFAPCPPANCPLVDGCPMSKRLARSLSLEEIRRALEADPNLASQIGIPPHMLANRPGHSIEQQLLALGGDHTVKRRLVVVNSEDQLRYYVRTGDIP